MTRAALVFFADYVSKGSEALALQGVFRFVHV